MIITLDGFCCQGKSYLGKKLAGELGLEFFSTGMLVRFVAYNFTKLRDEISDKKMILEKAIKITEATEIDEIKMCEYLHTKDTEKALKIVSEYPFVDERLVKVLITYAKNRDIILDGRFTFNIFPDAHRNYYFKTTIEKRAKLASKSRKISLDEAIEYINFRDSFEKDLDIRESVRVIELSTFTNEYEIINYMKEDITR